MTGRLQTTSSPGAPGIFKHNYTRAMNPRLVKFPSWGLPQTGSGTAVFFGNADDAGGKKGSSINVRIRNEVSDLVGVRAFFIYML